MLIVHIIISVLSIVLSIISVVSPSSRKLTAGKLLISMTFASGLALAVQGANLAHLCISGLIFIGLASSLLLVSRHRLALSN